jgi:hypothetical protein
MADCKLKLATGQSRNADCPIEQLRQAKGLSRSGAKAYLAEQEKLAKKSGEVEPRQGNGIADSAATDTKNHDS